MRKTKIICTIGPASESEEVLTAMCRAGMNVARVNFSHGTHEEHAAKMDNIKKVRERLNRPVAIMLDTKGPEVRTKLIAGEKTALSAGQTFTLTTREVEGSGEIVSVTYPRLPELVPIGARILIDDGLLAMTDPAG